MTAILLFFILMVLLFGSAAVLSFFQGALALGVIAFLLTAAVALCFFLLACLFHGANAIGQGAKWLVNNPQVVGGKIRLLGFGLFKFAFYPFFFVGVCIRDIKELVSDTPKMTLGGITAWGWSICIFTIMSLLLFGLYFAAYAGIAISIANWYGGIR
jgi:hypothetical protein